MNIVADDCLTESESSSNGNDVTEMSLFIGDLNKDVVEKDLIDCFSKFGEVVEAIVKRSRTTQMSLGYGFVVMKSSEIAQLCIQQAQNIVIKGRKIRIGKAQRNSTLLVTQLGKSATLSSLLQLFGQFGSLLPEESILSQNESSTLNTAIIKYVNRKNAEEAKTSLNGANIFDNLIKIEWARPYSFPSFTNEPEGSEIPSQSDSQEEYISSYVAPSHHLPYSPSYASPPLLQDPIVSVYVKYYTSAGRYVTEEDIKKVFERYGVVTCVSIKTNTLDQGHDQQKGYAFVHYDVSSEGRLSAYQAVNALADTIVDNVRYITEFSRNFMRLEYSLNERQVRPRYCGGFSPHGVGFYSSPPNSIGQRFVYPYPYPYPSYPIPMLPNASPYYLPMQYSPSPYTPPPPPPFPLSTPRLHPHPHPHSHSHSHSHHFPYHPHLQHQYPLHSSQYQSQTNSLPGNYQTNAEYQGNGSGSVESSHSGSSNWSPLEDPIVGPEYPLPFQSSMSQDSPQHWPTPFFPMAYPSHQQLSSQGNGHGLGHGVYAYAPSLHSSYMSPSPSYYPSPYPYQTSTEEN